ncbi:hypothetical protein MNBD_GAMMA12-1210 [hydrothermal vent metagenome]|uniref:J domain-containing protein n=1 Tax=hydrothermal vent metagenome TaxID=652676 RepID=A0A3B0YZ78_9ZZZZ
MSKKLSRIFETKEYADFQAKVHSLLLLHTQCLSEYDLLDLLKKDSNFSFIKNIFESNLSLFHSHFILFHCLYSLRITLLQQEAGVLNISAMNIQLQPYADSTIDSLSSLEQADPLQEYYLDHSQLDSVEEKELNNMIDKFWHTLAANEARPAALHTLGLKDPVEDVDIKKMWRKLVMQHHPDRGGDNQTLQSINKAFNILISK